jgi:hypothetical protein
MLRIPAAALDPAAERAASAARSPLMKLSSDHIVAPVAIATAVVMPTSSRKPCTRAFAVEIENHIRILDRHRAAEKYTILPMEDLCIGASQRRLGRCWKLL